MSLEKLIDQYHQAVDEFSRSNPEPVKALFSHRDDVTLANPFGPAVRGWKQLPTPSSLLHRGSEMARSMTSRGSLSMRVLTLQPFSKLSGGGQKLVTGKTSSRSICE
jgi:hypothetical protein